jgi:putative glutamine amidotransferase
VSYRPLIAVVAYHLDDGRVARWPAGGYGVPAPYIEALRRADARTAIVSPGEPGDADEILDPFDGLLLVGGGDVDPARYGAQPDTAHNYGVEPDRDGLEIALLHEADRRHMPTLCICRGAQVMNVAFGGTLHQHLPDMDGLLEHGVPLEGTETLHDVAPEPGTRLSATTKAGTLRCSSHHHQGIDRVGEGVDVSGRSPDGLVEAIERGVLDMNAPDAGWMLGVQWHPEETAADDPAQQRLFEALVLLARFTGQVPHGGGSREYRVVDPDPGWPAVFEAEAERLRAALPPDLVVSIDHVGSTSVPGLAAKPVIDMELAVTSMVPVDAYRAPLLALGYAHDIDPWNDDHEFFSRKSADRYEGVNLHVCEAGSRWERRHLAFRDWLRSHPEDAAAYGRLKRELADAHPRDIVAYLDGKTEFIERLTDRAVAASVPLQQD